MKKITISPEDLKKLIKEEASKILKEEADKITDAGDSLEVDMNQLDRVDNSDGSAFIGVERSQIPCDLARRRMCIYSVIRGTVELGFFGKHKFYYGFFSSSVTPDNLVWSGLAAPQRTRKDWLNKVRATMTETNT